jgi:hypothetical protein
MKFLSVVAELYHRSDGRTDRQTDRQTYMTKLIVAFRIFSKARKDEGLRIFHKVSVEITVHFLKKEYFFISEFK